jgi:hypothetical protein
VIKHTDYTEYVSEDLAVLPVYYAGEREINSVEEMVTGVAGGGGALVVV